MDELDVMRQQFADMKRQLDTQQIVNKDLMHKVMRGKVSWMNILVKGEVIALPLLTLLFLRISSNLGISLWYAIAFFILAGIDTLGDFYTVRIPTRLFSTCSMLDLKKFLVRQKTLRFRQVCVSLPLSLIWVALFAYQLTYHLNMELADNAEHALLIGIILGAGVGVVVAVIVVVSLYRKMQLTNDQLLSDIRLLQAED